MSRAPHDVRGTLTPDTSVQDFRDFYWLKAELLEFCREHGLSTAGGKRALADRVELFLRTGRRAAPPPDLAPAAGRRTVKAPTLGPLSASTRAEAGFRCTQEARAWFEGLLGPSFRFTVALQGFIREHPGVTLGEIAEEWKRQRASKQSGAQSEIAPQFEYNRFTRDFFADPRNQGKSRGDCVEAWRRVRDRRGDNRYRSDDPER